MNDNTMNIKIFSISKGLEEKSGIKLIRIKSKKYNLLIMDDYLPILGEIDGNVDFESDAESISYKDIKGYYMHSNDEFNLIINEV